MNKWIEKMRKMEGALTTERGARFESIIKSGSPSVDWIYGNTHGLPLGYSTVLWGPAKSGKSLLNFGFAGQLHQSDPEAIVVKFDTEFRDDGQLSEESARNFGIDLDRYMVFQVNRPDQVFDRIRNELQAMVQAGAPIKFVIVDSISGILGRREADTDTVTQHNIGDLAQTTKVGLKMIQEFVKRLNIALVLTAHAAVEMDPWEVKRGNKTKMAAAGGVQHFCEYFVNIERNATKAGRATELGEELVNEARKDLVDSAEQTGHKIRVWMQNSTVGPAGRMAEFTVDYRKGIINTHEELFRLGINWRIITKLNPLTFSVNGQTFTGKPKMLEALKTSPQLQQHIKDTLLAMDQDGGQGFGSGPVELLDEDKV